MDIFFDSGHDMTLDGQDIKFTDSDSSVVQRITIRLQFLLGEWFLDTTRGVPYTQTIFKKGTSLSDIYNIIRKHILETDGVLSLKKLDLTPSADERNLVVDFEVMEEEGSSSGSVNISI